MRVLHLMAGAKEGGAESIMVDAALALAEAGVIQHVITRDHNPARLSTIRQAGVLVSIADFGRFWRRPTQRVIQLAIDNFRPDILQFWMGRAGTFAPERWRARSVGWYGGYYEVSRFENCAWHVGMTRDIAAHIVRGGISPERVSVLNSYANVGTSPPIARCTIDTPDDAPVILTLARLHEKKGIDTLLEALVGLPGVHAWIAGAGPIEEELKALSRKLGVTDRAHFLGWRTDRANLLAACNLVAIPSRYEPFGNVVIEAWASERPLVAADAVGPANTVTNELDAILVPRDDPLALREALRRVISDAGLAGRLVENGKLTYQARFTKEAFVRSSRALYERMISTNDV